MSNFRPALSRGVSGENGMKKLNYIKKKTSRFFVTANKQMFGFIKFDCKVDLIKGEYLDSSDEGYKDSGLPTLNDLCEMSVVAQSFPYREYDIYPKVKNGQINVDSIIKEFSENGFDVSRKAIEHNFDAWRRDEKSGYRGKGYHLFSPCGCNPLRLSATSLSRLCDWQITYNC